MRHKFLAIFFLYSIFTVLFCTNTSFADEAIIESDHLNVRTGPGTEYDKVTQLHSGEVYQILQIDNDWVEIDLEGRSGWITNEYITINKLTEEDININKPVSENATSLTIENNNTHIRSGPSVDYDIIGFAKLGAEYEIMSTDTDFYEIDFDGKKGFIFKSLLNKKQLTKNTTLKNKVIVIDAGHGGHDVGSIGVSGHYEKDLTYKTAMELKEELSMLGAEVILTRENDDYIRLGSRPAISNINTTDAFISIHYNSFPEQSNVTGINSYYYHEQNKSLSSHIQQGIVDSTNSKDRGIAYGDFQVLRSNFMPSVLLELDFISNPEREQLLLTNSYQKKLVQGIINGLTNYFAKK